MMTELFPEHPLILLKIEKLKIFHLTLLQFDKEPSKAFTLDNYLVLLKAMMRHDISLEFNGSMEEAAKTITAKLFIIVSETDMMVNPTEAIKFCRINGSKKVSSS